MKKKLANINLHSTGASVTTNSMGMREMQAKAYEKADKQYVILKSPPASGKSRACEFIALKKLHDGTVKKAVIAIPERSIAKSYHPIELSKWGFPWDWEVTDGYDLCRPGSETGKVNAFGRFINDPNAKILLCTHATLRSAYNKYGVDAFHETFVAIDEFHHVSEDEDNKLGELVRDLISEGSVHILAMTGSYFRGDRVPVLSPEDEEVFDRVTYTYYQQMDGYKYLKSLGINVAFYNGDYIDALPDALDTTRKTIIYIPSVNSAASTKDKYNETDMILDVIGEIDHVDESTGIIYIRNKDDGRMLRVADLVNDNPREREKVVTYLDQMEDTGNDVDIIIALGMAKEGFDWPACESTLVIGPRNSLTEVVQVVGRCTRDYPGKEHADYLNLVAAPDATREDTITAINNLDKAIVASLLMEDVLEPKLTFKSKKSSVDDPASTVEINGMRDPSTKKAKDIVENDLEDLLAAILQDPDVLKAVNGVVGAHTINRALVPKVIIEKYPNLTDDEIEEIRQQAVTRLVLRGSRLGVDEDGTTTVQNSREAFRIPVRVDHIDIDLIDSINPFLDAYEILSKSFDAKMLKAIKEVIDSFSIDMTADEALALWPDINSFYKAMGRVPDIDSMNSDERRLGEALAYLRRMRRETTEEIQHEE
jgi:superfamily II DNA or RNA helicase